MIFPFWF